MQRVSPVFLLLLILSMRKFLQSSTITIFHYHQFTHGTRLFRVGTHCWASRQWCGSVENGFREVYEIDSSLVEEAANYIPSARQFLQGESLINKFCVGMKRKLETKESTPVRVKGISG